MRVLNTWDTCTFLYPLLCTVMIFAFSVFCLAIVSATSSLLKKPKRDRWPRMDFLSDYCCATELFISGILLVTIYYILTFLSFKKRHIEITRTLILFFSYFIN